MKKAAPEPTPVREMESLNKPKSFFSFAKSSAGTTLEGTYGGMESGKFDSDNHILFVNDAPVKFAASAGLQDLKSVKFGAFVRVTHEGLVLGKNGREYRSFHLEVEKGGRKDAQGTI